MMALGGTSGGGQTQFPNPRGRSLHLWTHGCSKAPLYRHRTNCLFWVAYTKRGDCGDPGNHRADPVERSTARRTPPEIAVDSSECWI